MYLHKKFVGGLVGGQHKTIHGMANVGIESLYHQMPIGVSATCSPYRFNKGLIEGILNGQMLGAGIGITAVQVHLIGSRKQQTIIVISEIGSNLLPICSQTGVKSFLLVVKRVIQPRS